MELLLSCPGHTKKNAPKRSTRCPELRHLHAHWEVAAPTKPLYPYNYSFLPSLKGPSRYQACRDPLGIKPSQAKSCRARVPWVKQLHSLLLSSIAKRGPASRCGPECTSVYCIKSDLYRTLYRLEGRKPGLKSQPSCYLWSSTLPQQAIAAAPPVVSTHTYAHNLLHRTFRTSV